MTAGARLAETCEALIITFCNPCHVFWFFPKGWKVPGRTSHRVSSQDRAYVRIGISHKLREAYGRLTLIIVLFPIKMSCLLDLKIVAECGSSSLFSPLKSCHLALNMRNNDCRQFVSTCWHLFSRRSKSSPSVSSNSLFQIPVMTSTAFTLISEQALTVHINYYFELR